MNELSLKWKQIFDEISLEDKHIEETVNYYIKGTVNYYNLTSILEDLYVENVKLKARVEALENKLMENKRVKINFEGCYD